MAARALLVKAATLGPFPQAVSASAESGGNCRAFRTWSELIGELCEFLPGCSSVFWPLLHRLCLEELQSAHDTASTEALLAQWQGIPAAVMDCFTEAVGAGFSKELDGLRTRVSGASLASFLSRTPVPQYWKLAAVIAQSDGKETKTVDTQPWMLRCRDPSAKCGDVLEALKSILSKAISVESLDIKGLSLDDDGSALTAIVCEMAQKW